MSISCADRARTHAATPAVTEPIHRFGDRAADYVRFRPGYPPALVEHLQRRGFLPESAIVADIGAGTGISSTLFLDAGCSVYAVEPNAPMRAAAERALDARGGFHSIDGRAEATTLGDSSVDLVSAAQAFHWFDVEHARTEWTRILRRGGVAAVYWNSRRLTGSPFLEGYERLLRQFGTDYTQVAERYQNDAAMQRWFGAALCDRAEFPNRQLLDFERLHGRLLSSSYAPRPGHSRHAAMISALRALFDATATSNRVEFEYRTRLFIGAPG